MNTKDIKTKWLRGDDTNGYKMFLLCDVIYGSIIGVHASFKRKVTRVPKLKQQ